MKEYMNVKQLHARLSGAVSIKQIYALVKQGKLRATRGFGKMLIEVDSVEELLAPTPIVVPTPVVVIPPKRGRKKSKEIELW